LKGKLDDLTSAVSTATDHHHHHFDGGEGRDGGRDDRGVMGGGAPGGGLSGGEADGNLSVGSSGGQLLRGMGNLILSGASGITGGIASGGGNGGGPIWDVNVNLEQFVESVVEKEGSSRKLGVRGRRKKGSESVDFGRGGAGSGGLSLALGNSSGVGLSGKSNGVSAGIPQSVVNGEYGAIVTMLWSGRVTDIVALREWEKERERAGILGWGLPNSASGAGASDGEEARSEGLGGRSTEGEDSDLQMEGRIGGSFGGVWSGRMQRKLGNWAGWVFILFPSILHSVDEVRGTGWGNEERKLRVLTLRSEVGPLAGQERARRTGLP
jgi:hypothetical protein